MKHLKWAFSLPLLLILYACPMAPGSRTYRPVDMEKIYFEQSTRCFLPNDARQFKDEINKNKLLNWTGIIRDIRTENSSDSLKLVVTVDHKYWDFIEDFGLQTEKIFLSEKGEGSFYLTKKFPTSYQSRLDSLTNSYHTNDFIIAYGYLKEDFQDVPELNAEYARVIPQRFYSTKIWRYDAEKDAEGRTLCNDRNTYNMANFESLSLPGAGSNE